MLTPFAPNAGPTGGAGFACPAGTCSFTKPIAFLGGAILFLLKKEVGLDKGSAVPHRDKVGEVTRAQLRKIAEIKEPDLNANSVEAAMKIIAGTARSMGLEVID